MKVVTARFTGPTVETGRPQIVATLLSDGEFVGTRTAELFEAAEVHGDTRPNFWSDMSRLTIAVLTLVAEGSSTRLTDSDVLVLCLPGIVDENRQRLLESATLAAWTEDKPLAGHLAGRIRCPVVLVTEEEVVAAVRGLQVNPTSPQAILTTAQRLGLIEVDEN